jgi:acetyl esterase
MSKPSIHGLLNHPRLLLAALTLFTPALLAEPPKPAHQAEPISAQSLTYKTVNGRSLKLLVEKPPTWKAADQRPAIVFFFGGGWVGGTAEQFRKQSEYFASRGLVGLRVEYRTLPKGDAGPPTICCADAKSAMRYVRAHAADLGIDPQRIAASGGSAGGHLAAFTSMVAGGDAPNEDPSISPRADALILFNPVFDNGPDAGGWGNQRVGDRVPQFSPAHNISADDPPTIVFLGRTDRLIPVTTVERFQAKMKSAGVRCDAFFYDQQGHGFFNKEPFLSKTLIAADTFLTSLGWLTGPPTRTAPEVTETPPSPASPK